MKDTATYKQTLIKTINTIHTDLNGIQCQLAEYVKSVKEGDNSVKTDTIFTVTVTLSIFILGILVDRVIKHCDRKRLEKERRTFFLYHITRANARLVSKLQETYLKYAKEISIDTGLTSTPPKVISSDFQRLLGIDYEQLFSAFKTKDVFSRVQSQIEFIDTVLKEVQGFHIRVYDESGIVREELAKISDEYLGLLSDYTKLQRATNANFTLSQTYNLLNNGIIRYYKELAGTRQLSVFYKEIVKPVQTRIVDSGEHDTDSILGAVAEKGRRLAHVVSRLEQILEEVSKQYETYSNYMRSANENLNTDIPILK